MAGGYLKSFLEAVPPSSLKYEPVGDPDTELRLWEDGPSPPMTFLDPSHVQLPFPPPCVSLKHIPQYHMKNAKGEDCTKFKNAASEVTFHVKFAGSKWKNFARGWQRGEDLSKDAEENSNLISSCRYVKVDDCRVKLREDAILGASPMPGDSKCIIEKFQELKNLGLIKIARTENEVKNPDTVTRLLRWGDFVIAHKLWDCWLELERIPGWGLTAISQWSFATIFLGMVRSQPDTAKFVLTVLRMSVAEAPELTRALREDCLKSLKTTAANMKNTIGTLALAYQIAKYNITSLKATAIDSEAKMKADFVIIDLALTDPEAFLRDAASDRSGVIGNMSDGANKLLNFVKNCLNGTFLPDMKASYVSQTSASSGQKPEEERAAEALQAKMQHASVRQHMKPLTDHWKELVKAKGSLAVEEQDEAESMKNLLKEAEEAEKARPTPKTYKQAVEEHADVEMRILSFLVDPQNAGDLKEALKKLDVCKRDKSNAKTNAATEGNLRGAHYDQALLSENPGSFL